MFLLETPLCLFHRDAFVLLSLFQPTAERSDGFSPLEPVKESLVAVSILNHNLGSAIHGEYPRGSLLLELREVVFQVPLKFGDGMNPTQVDHDLRVPLIESAHYRMIAGCPVSNWIRPGRDAQVR